MRARAHYMSDGLAHVHAFDGYAQYAAGFVTEPVYCACQSAVCGVSTSVLHSTWLPERKSHLLSFRFGRKKNEGKRPQMKPPRCAQ